MLNVFQDGRSAPRRGSRSVGKVACDCLRQLLVMIHTVFDWLVDYLFGLYYNETTRKHIPNVEQPFLTDSALALARKIRNREVRYNQASIKTNIISKYCI